MKKITVSPDGSGDYKTLAEALAKSAEGTEIFIKKGTYKEKLVISTPNIKLVGEDRDATILTFDSGALDKDENGEPIGTFKTASVHVKRDAEGFSAYSLTIENSAGMGDEAGQAVALYIDCDKAVIKDCTLRARQDTLLTAPYFKDIELDPTWKNRQLFDNCLIEGDVDFIFGGAVAVFKDCEIKSLDRDREINGYVTAACTGSLLKYGYVFLDCRFTTDSCAEGTVYLGRPWREFANTVFINCRFGKHISPKGFSEWGDTDRHKTCFYAQYASVGENYNESKLADWTHVLTDKDVEKYTVENIFEGWVPDCL